MKAAAQIWISNGTAVFRIHIESELKLGLSVSITLLLLMLSEGGIRNKIGIERFPAELGFNKLSQPSSLCHILSEKHGIKIDTVLIVNVSQVLDWPACMVAPSVVLASLPQNLRSTSHRRCRQKCHNLGWNPSNLQVDFLAKLSLGLSLSEQRSPDPAPRTRWDVSDDDYYSCCSHFCGDHLLFDQCFLISGSRGQGTQSNIKKPKNAFI